MPRLSGIALCCSALLASSLIAGEAEKPASQLQIGTSRVPVAQAAEAPKKGLQAKSTKPGTSAPLPVGAGPGMRFEERAIFVDGRVQTVRVAVPVVPPNQNPAKKADPNNPLPAAIPANVAPFPRRNAGIMVRNGRIIRNQNAQFPQYQAPARDPNEPIEAPRPPASVQEIQTWIQQLQDREYAVRNRAMLRLIAEGERAVAAVGKAADCDELERSSRCVEILRKIAISEDAAARSSAIAALQRLAKSERKFVARRVALILPFVEPSQVAQNNRMGGAVFAAPFGPAQANVQIQFAPAQPVFNLKREVKFEEKGKKYHIIQALGGANRSLVIRKTEKDAAGKEKVTETKVSNPLELRKLDPDLYELYRKHIRGAAVQQVVGPGGNVNNIQLRGLNGINGNNVQVRATNINGVRTVQVDENGRMISLTDKAGKEIKIVVVETQGRGGKRVVQKYEAADLADLKKKHPDAAKLYEKYSGAGGGNNIAVQIVNGGLQINGVPQPGFVLPVQGFPGIVPVAPAGGFQPLPAGPRNVDLPARKSVLQAKERLIAAEQRLRQLSQEKELKPADLQPVLREIESARRALEESERQRPAVAPAGPGER